MKSSCFIFFPLVPETIIAKKHLIVDEVLRVPYDSSLHSHFILPDSCPHSGNPLSEVVEEEEILKEQIRKNLFAFIPTLQLKTDLISEAQSIPQYPPICLPPPA